MSLVYMYRALQAGAERLWDSRSSLVSQLFKPGSGPTLPNLDIPFSSHTKLPILENSGTRFFGGGELESSYNPVMSNRPITFEEDCSLNNSKLRLGCEQLCLPTRDRKRNTEATGTVITVFGFAITPTLTPGRGGI